MEFLTVLIFQNLGEKIIERERSVLLWLILQWFYGLICHLISFANLYNLFSSMLIWNSEMRWNPEFATI